MPPTFIDLTMTRSPPPRATLAPTVEKPQAVPVATTAAAEKAPSPPIIDADYHHNLQDAISTATLPRLQAVLRMICEANPDAARLAGDCFLLVPQDEEGGKDSSVAREKEKEKEKGKGNAPAGENPAMKTKVSEPTHSSTEPSLNKREYTRYVTCENCSEGFDPSANTSEEDCYWHEGWLEVDEDSDTWYQWEEYNGPMDTEENRGRFPGGFVWDCCNEAGGSPGCQTGRHVEMIVSAKKVRT